MTHWFREIWLQLDWTPVNLGESFLTIGVKQNLTSVEGIDKNPGVLKLWAN
jgi:hypothetical protein